MSYFDEVLATLSTLDRFGRLPVAQPAALFDNQMEYGSNPLLWEQSSGSGGAYTADNFANRLTLSLGGTAQGLWACEQTKVYQRYQPGRALQLDTTFVMSGSAANSVRRVGYFDHLNGIFLESSGSSVNIVLRSSTGAEKVSNGAFTSGSTGWTASASTTIARTTAYGAGELTITNGSAGAGYTYQQITGLTAGVRYVASATARVGTASGASLSVGTSAGNTSLGQVVTTTTGGSSGFVPARQGDQLCVTFTPAATSAFINLGNVSSTNGHTSVWDNVSVRAVDTIYPQASWNKDPLNGSGASGVTLDLTKATLMRIQIGYLGVDGFAVYFKIQGTVYLAHEAVFSNSASAVYMSTGCLPVRGEVCTPGGATSGTPSLDMICSSVSSNGEGVERIPGSASNGITTKSTSTTLAPVLSIRAARFLGNTNALETSGSTGYLARGQILPSDISLFATGQTHQYQLLLNPTTLGGAAWVTSGSASIVEYDTSGSSVAGGLVLAEGYVAAGAKADATLKALLQNIFPLTQTGLQNVQQVLTLAARTTTLTGTVLGVITWEEIY